MATYAIGDIQGCFFALEKLLTHIQFNPVKDTLWFAGDLVNRGPQSLETLRFVKALGNKHKVVLGNHDLHLLAVYFGERKQNRKDTLQDILTAPDCDELIHWLRMQPLLHHDATLGYIMVHAGLCSKWHLQQAKQLAHEVELQLQTDPRDFLEHMYGDTPDEWRDDLFGADRLRCITNYFTRLRFCYADGRMNLTYKGTITDKPEELIPWFELPNPVAANSKIIFGHWAALNGECNQPDYFALDTGCVWGNCLTGVCLETRENFSVECY